VLSLSAPYGVGVAGTLSLFSGLTSNEGLRALDQNLTAFFSPHSALVSSLRQAPVSGGGPGIAFEVPDFNRRRRAAAETEGLAAAAAAVEEQNREQQPASAHAEDEEGGAVGAGGAGAADANAVRAHHFGREQGQVREHRSQKALERLRERSAAAARALAGSPQFDVWNLTVTVLVRPSLQNATLADAQAGVLAAIKSPFFFANLSAVLAGALGIVAANAGLPPSQLVLVYNVAAGGPAVLPTIGPTPSPTPVPSTNVIVVVNTLPGTGDQQLQQSLGISLGVTIPLIVLLAMFAWQKHVAHAAAVRRGGGGGKGFPLGSSGPSAGEENPVLVTNPARTPGGSAAKTPKGGASSAKSSRSLGAGSSAKAPARRDSSVSLGDAEAGAASAKRSAAKATPTSVVRGALGASGAKSAGGSGAKASGGSALASRAKSFRIEQAKREVADSRRSSAANSDAF